MEETEPGCGEAQSRPSLPSDIPIGPLEDGEAAQQTPGPRPTTTLADEVVAHLPAMRGFARSMTKSAVEADDLVQEALLRAIEHIHQFRPGTNLRAWLFRILRNCFYSHVMKRGREGPGTKECVSQLPTAIPDGQLWNLQRKEVEAAMQNLPVAQREALLLVVVVGASYVEAAEILQCDIGTIKSRINRARAGLRAQVGEIFLR